MKWYDRRTDLQKLVLSWWEFHVASPLRYSQPVLVFLSVFGYCRECHRQGFHKFGCYTGRRDRAKKLDKEW